MSITVSFVGICERGNFRRGVWGLLGPHRIDFTSGLVWWVSRLHMFKLKHSADKNSRKRTRSRCFTGVSVSLCMHGTTTVTSQRTIPTLTL